MLKIGFTGTRRGLTIYQLETLSRILPILDPIEFHHGDCIGADYLAHQLLVGNIHRSLQHPCRIVIHPPSNPQLRAWCSEGDDLLVLEEKEYLDRDRDIVDASDIVLVCPKTSQEEIRSGTWATYRYARRMGKTVLMILPKTGEILQY